MPKAERFFMMTGPHFHVEIDHIRRHYDRLSLLYRFFWGEHIHHGYWDAEFTPAQAQVRLMERLAEEAHVKRGAKVLDIGCGLGGSAFWLADKFACEVTGMTISPVQARMASKKRKRAASAGKPAVVAASPTGKPAASPGCTGNGTKKPESRAEAGY